MTSIQSSLPFDAPSLSDIYMSDEDDGDHLSHDDNNDDDCSSGAGSLFEMYRPQSPQNDNALIADMPAQSVSMIQTTQSPRSPSSSVRSNNQQRRSRTSRYPYRKNQPSPGNDPPGFDQTYSLDLTRFIYTIPDVEETYSNVPMTPTPTRKDGRAPSSTVESTIPKTAQYIQQRRMHLCVIFLTFMFLLLGISVAVIGHKIYEGADEPISASALEKEGSMAAVPIALPNIFSSRPPTRSPVSATTAPSIFPEGISPTAVPTVHFNLMTPTPTFGPTLQPIIRQTQLPTPQPTQRHTTQPVSESLVSPSSITPTPGPRTPRPTPERRRPEPTVSPIMFTSEPTFVPGKKAKGAKRQ